MSSNRHGISRLGVLGLQLALGLTALASHGQTTAPATPRILSAVDTSQMVTLRGNTHPLAQARFDRGRLDDAAPTGRMMLVLKRGEEQQAALELMLAAQQDPKSGSYHKWLTPESFGAQFGVADADIQAVSSFLSSEGFTVSRVLPNKMAIEFSGTIGQIRSTFQTEIHTYAANGQTFHANASDPRIPAALAPAVAGIASLNNYKTARPSTPLPLVLNKTGKIKPLYSDPNIFLAETISPGDLAVIYDIPSTSNAQQGTLPLASNGQGVTIGVVNDSNINLSIAANYRTTFGLAANTPTVIVDGSDPGINGDDVLGYQAVELISAVAPAATINYYVSGDTDFDGGLDFAAFRAVLDDTVQVLVFPFEKCERDLGVSDNLVFTSLWELAAAEGISVIVPSGNGGSEECDAVPLGTPKTTANQGLAINGYASTAFNTAVGASDFFYQTGLVGIFNYFHVGNGANTGYTSAYNGYVPEQPYNNSNPANHINTFINPPVAAVQATGGGISTLGQVTPNDSNPSLSTQGPHPQPSYQGNAARGISTTARVIPDVSMFGGVMNNLSSYILCINANDCVNGSPASLQYTPMGGSTTSASVFAGVAALVVQAKGAQGNLNPALYATQAAVPNAFHDITAGENAVACTGANCSGGFSSTGTGVAYAAGTGYDAATGLGSVDVRNLIAGWQNPPPAPTIQFTLTQPSTNTPVVFPLAHGKPVQVNVHVSGSSGVATGDVAITSTTPQAANAAIERLTLDGSGNATDPNLTFLPGGSYNVVARYAGDTHYGPVVSASIPVTISGRSSAIAVVSQNFTGGSTQTYGAPIQFTLGVFDPNSGFVGSATGSITINDSNLQSTILPLNSVGAVTFQSERLDPGLHTFTATYSGDLSYAGSSVSGGPLTVNVVGAPTTTSLTSATTSLPSRNSTVSLVATVTPAAPIVQPSGGVIGSGGRPPRGNVQFIVNGKVGATVPVDLGQNSGTSPSATAIFREGANGFPSGPSTVTATYVPDTSGDYAASSSAPVNLNVGSAGGLASAAVALTTTPQNAVNFINTSAVSFTATVSAPGNSSITGAVVFYSNGTQLGQPVQLNNNVATLNVPSTGGVLNLPLGQSYIVAEYSGDNNNSSASGFYAVNIYGAGSTPDFTMQSLQSYGTLSPTVTSMSFRLQFASLDGFSQIHQNVTLSFSTPAAITCMTTPTANSPVQFNGVIYTNKNISCGAAAGYTVASLSEPRPPLLWMAEGGAALACVLLFGMPTRRRSWQAMIGSLGLIVVAFGMTGCGVNLPDPSKSTTTKSAAFGTTGANATLARGTYTVLVTGTANVFPTANSGSNTTVTVVHTLPLNIVVQ